jgi:hypothetical protein
MKRKTIWGIIIWIKSKEELSMKRAMVILGSFLFLLALGASSWAYTVTVNFDPGVIQSIPGVAQSSNGATMAGMEVQTHREGMAGQPLDDISIWQATGPESGEIPPNIYFLSESGDTFVSEWAMGYLGTASHLSKLTIDAFKGNTVFDTSFDEEEGNTGTLGSGLGKTFKVISYTTDYGLSDVVVTYRDQVAKEGNAPVGDLYRYLDIEFVGGFRGMPGILEFIADTDSIILTPVPPTAWLFGLGLAVLGLATRKRMAV